MKYIHVIPLDKFSLNLCEVILESNRNNFIFIYGSRLSINEKLKYEKLIKTFKTEIYFFNKSLSSFIALIKYFRLIISKKKLKSIFHCSDIINVKILLFISILFRHKFLWHARGTDLYSPLYFNYPFILKILNHFIYERCSGIISNTYYDALVAKNTYRPDLKHIRMIASPSNTIDQKSLLRFIKKENKVLVGNSGTYTSGSLFFLKNYQEIISNMNNFKFVFGSSYGHEKYSKLLFENSKNLNNVEIQTKFLKREDYLKFLSEFKIAVFLPVRPQGLSALSNLIYFKCTIYTSKNNPIGFYLEQFKLKYKILENESNKLFELSNSDLEYNKKIIIDEFSYEKCLKQWSCLSE